MSEAASSLDAFLSRDRSVIRIALTRVRGSSPRNVGTEMFVSAKALWGTVGGGQLEFRAIEAARAMLSEGALSQTLDIPLGPEIGQCCGGRVEIALTRLRSSDRRAAIDRAKQADAALPHVYVMGAGHVGRALAQQFQHLPVRCILIDPREEEIAHCTAAIETRVSAIPEIDIMKAPADSAFVVLTHDHGLDFLLTSAALERDDAAYVGMIGSGTKRVKFRNWAHRNNEGLILDHLTCPIGAGGSNDKRPAVIAAFVVAEVMASLTTQRAAKTPQRAPQEPYTGIHHDREGQSA